MHVLTWMADQSSLRQRKAAFFMLFGSFSFMVLVLGFLPLKGNAPPDGNDGTLAVLNVVAMGSLLACSVLGILLLKPKSQLGEAARPLDPQLLQRNTLICLSIGEVCTLVGVVLVATGRAASAVPYSVGTLIVYLLLLMPLSIAQWNLIESRNE